MKLNREFYYSIILSCCLTSLPVFANDDDEDIPFDEAQLFFELNNTDGDLGIHGKIDGDEWKKLTIEDPYERRMMKVRINGRLKRQGLTELFFESAEPTFDELDPADFFKRFPEGIYEIEGVTLDGEERENEVELSHIIPAAPDNVLVSGEPATEDCDSEDITSVYSPITLSWDAVTSSHPTLGKDGDVEVDYYEVVVENEDSELVMSTMLPADVTELTIPQGFIDLNDEFKFEILVRADNGNKTAMESCFEVE
ncbi:MAG: hypothetical protein OQK04_17445 [Kangiellaceae bacterium]|nr:hypothetical protein [Kangiellaceae bacterium]MCW9000499.1 hypothetical protein [Kangiellaceae bacterium]